MYGQAPIEDIMRTFTDGCKALFGERLYDVRLFGSYARGDYREDSDIDVMVIVDMDADEAKGYEDGVKTLENGIDADFNYRYLLMPVLRSKALYDKRSTFPGFYNNVLKEGISYYVR